MRVVQYVSHFACPWCDPWSFGMARAYAASVLARGVLRFDAARTLLETSRNLLGRGPRSAWRGRLKHERKEALERLDVTWKSVKLGMKGSWFERWACSK